MLLKNNSIEYFYYNNNDYINRGAKVQVDEFIYYDFFSIKWIGFLHKDGEGDGFLNGDGMGNINFYDNETLDNCVNGY